MTRNKLYAIFFAIVSCGAAAFYFVYAGYYPIAVVNGHFITSKSFNDGYATTWSYYNIILKSLKDSSSTEQMPQVSTPVQIQQSVLSGLIDNALIEDGARAEVGSDLNRLVDEKISELASGNGVAEAVKAFYGLSMNDFKNEILRPQAERDILTGNLLLKGKKIDDWLASEKKSSRITIFSDVFYWDGGKVETKTQ